MRTVGMAVAAVCLVGVVGCAGQGASSDPITSTVLVDSHGNRIDESDVDLAEPTAEEEADPFGEASAPTSQTPEEMYAQVLSNPAAVPINSAARYEPLGTYSYAFVEASGDARPEMLLRVNGAEFSPIVVLTIDDDGKVISSDSVLIAGAASAGGSRAYVVASASGQGLYQVDSHSLSPTATSTHYRLVGGDLAEGVSEEFDHMAGDLPDHQEIQWRDLGAS